MSQPGRRIGEGVDSGWGNFMSAIDQYKYECMGKVKCPSSFDIVYANNTREILLYRLKQDIPGDETDFDDKSGDILLGGGSGEAPALRISIPKAISLYTDDYWDNFNDRDEIYKAFWSPAQAYVMCDGYRKLGSEPTTSISEAWLIEHVLSFLRRNFQHKYLAHFGDLTLECDGSIVCLYPKKKKE